MVTILDSTLDQDAGVIHHEVLEVDDEGNTPDRDKFKRPSQHSIEIIMRNKRRLEACNSTNIQNFYH